MDCNETRGTSRNSDQQVHPAMSALLDLLRTKGFSKPKDTTLSCSLTKMSQGKNVVFNELTPNDLGENIFEDTAFSQSFLILLSGFRAPFYKERTHFKIKLVNPSRSVPFILICTLIFIKSL